MAHSPVGASGMYRWVNCPGSVRLSRGIESVPSFAAAEGTVAHAIGEARLRGERPSKVGTIIQQDGHAVEVTQEMLDAVQVYIDTVRDERMPGDTVLIEHGFHLKDLHEDLYGTADCVIWCPSMKLLTVIDYKHGAGIAVEVEGNPQVKYYALGALLTANYPAKRVRVAIVQPRCPHQDGPVRSQEFDAIDLLEFQADLLEAVKRTEAPDAPLAVGDWCRFCPALATCPAQAKHAQEVARVSFAAPATLPPEPGTLTVEQVSKILDRLPILEGWAKAVREHAYTQAESGVDVPGYKLVQKIAHRKVKADVTAETLAQAAGREAEDFYKEPELLGIADLEKRMPGKNAKERAAALEPFVVKESTGHVLVPVSDRRDAINPQAAAKLAFQPEKP